MRALAFGSSSQPHQSRHEQALSYAQLSVKQFTHNSTAFSLVTTHGTRPDSRCPDCRRASPAIHTRSRQRPADLPSRGRALRIDLRVRRFFCHDAAFARHTFAERLPDLLRPHARRTRSSPRPSGGSGGAQGEAVHACFSTCPCRRARTRAAPRSRSPAARARPPHVVRVDDSALRGRTYGAIVINLERRHMLDCSRSYGRALADRCVATAARVSSPRPLTRICPRPRPRCAGARQVANRWHLLANMRQCSSSGSPAHARLQHLPAGRRSRRRASDSRTRPLGAPRPRAARLAAGRGGSRSTEVKQRTPQASCSRSARRSTSRRQCASMPTPRASRARCVPQVQHPRSLPRPLEHGSQLQEQADPMARVAAPGFTKQPAVHPGSRSTRGRRLGYSPQSQPTARHQAVPARPARPPAFPSPARLAWLLVQPPAGSRRPMQAS